MRRLPQTARTTGAKGRLGLVAALIMAGCAAAAAEPLVLPVTHTPPSGGFTFRTPEGWTLAPVGTDPARVQASDGPLIVRFLYRKGEVGHDAFHAICMLEHLAPETAIDPRVKYEYDYVGGTVAGREALDSAFVVRYDAAIRGYRDWRQRSLTLVGQGDSLCAVSYAPVAVWKKSRKTRALLDAVLASVRFAAGTR